MLAKKNVPQAAIFILGLAAVGEAFTFDGREEGEALLKAMKGYLGKSLRDPTDKAKQSKWNCLKRPMPFYHC